VTDTEPNVGTHHGNLKPISAPLLPWPVDPVVEPIHTRFERITALAPDGIAVESVDGEPQTTYRELNERANGIAVRLLTDLGDGNHRVAVLGDSAVAHIASVLGILKAGKAAVPLHGANPDSRLEYILQHSESAAILAYAEDADRAGAIAASASDVQMIEPPSGAIENPEVVVDVDATARIMYTSGSTGAPKGATQSNRYLFEKERFAQQFYAFGVEDRVSQLFPLAFAASTTHTLGALLNGGRLVPYEIAELGIHHLGDWLDEAQITALAMVPTLLRRFLQTVPDGRVFDSVRFVMVGAEVALRGDVELFAKHFPAECRFVHRLAATEAGEIAQYVVSDPDQLNDAVVPAGFPGGGKELLILDDEANPVPDGQIGELVVRSANLSQGYWRDPELNARVFVIDPDDPSMRRYHTGDLARVRSDGTLQHLGRKDGRIKIRGFGVDLTEVEHVMLDAPGVVEGVVVAPEIQTGERRLVAYFVANDSFEEAALRAHFKSHLPGYMVPTASVTLKQLPLTPRGKVDRRALTERDLEVVERHYAEPETELEVDLAAIWSDVLGLDQVGLDDDFFQLGGDSIQAYELIAAVYHRLGVDLPASTLLSAATVRAQAELIASGSGRSARSLVPFRETGSQEPFFCVHGVGGGVMFLKKLLPHLDPDRPIYGLQPAIMEDEDAVYETVTEMAKEYIAEIRTLQPTGPYFIGGSCFGGLVAQEMARLLDEGGDTVAFLALIDPSSPNYQRPEVSRWLATKRRARKIVRARRAGRIQAKKQERWDRTQHLRKLHAKAAKEHRPQRSEVPLYILGARKQSARHEWMWGATQNGNITIEEFPANHSEMYEPRNAEYIAKMLNRQWAEVSAESPPTPLT